MTGWEIAIKASVGKLQLPLDPSKWFDEALQSSSFALLRIDKPHVFAAASLPLLHRDPFDRILLAQAAGEGLTLVTRDRKLAQYGLPIFWA